jgi:hypothetical protein
MDKPFEDNRQWLTPLEAKGTQRYREVVHKMAMKYKQASTD